jgi:beta-lactamase superfamily II metal-dependent hydrolase
VKENKIKGFFVTHKHLDHIRGADVLIQRNKVKIEYLIINLDYNHATSAVCNLLASARNKGLTFINCNKVSVLNEGQTTITVHNPTEKTRSRDCCPNINNSSISICVRVGDDGVVLTGDVSHKTLLESYPCLCACNLSNRVLKISHHGSYTGTNESVLKAFKPKFAFISAGESKRYHHPHQKTLDLLNKDKISVIVSKKQKNDVCYEITGSDIFLYDDISQMSQMTLPYNVSEIQSMQCLFQDILKAKGMARCQKCRQI